MTTLKSIHVEGFRSIRQADIPDLGPTTVLIGPNGAGKSNLIQLLKMVCMMTSGSLGLYVSNAGGASRLLHYGPKRTKQIEIRLEFVGGPLTHLYEVGLGFAANETLVFHKERTGLATGKGALSVVWDELSAGHTEAGIRDEAGPSVGGVRQALERMNFFHFHDTSVNGPLRTNSSAEDSAYLRSDGRNLATCLRTIQQGEDDGSRASWRRISSLVSQVAPFIKELQPIPVDPLGRFLRLRWVDEQDEVFGPHDLSDGTLRAIALITALAQPSSRLPSFVAIDEPELGLHPTAIRLLVELIRSVSSRCQVVLATQSPALLDHFEASEVIVADRVAGESRFRRLDEHELSSWLDDYSLSQLYDKNLLGGRP